MIKENIELEQLKQIFDQNHTDYIHNKDAIDSNMKKVVYLTDKQVNGYAVVYEGMDFLKQEHYPIVIKVTDPSLYIWHIITKLGHEGKGVATSILNYIIITYPDYDLYSAIDITNQKSIRCHEKVGFKKIAYFSHDGAYYHLLQHKKES